MKSYLTLITNSFLCSCVFAQPVISPDTISSNMTWDADTILLQSDVTVLNGVTLTIAPGVQILADGYYALEIKGRILAEGTEDEPILFSVSDSTQFSDSTSIAGGWDGIHFDSIDAVANDTSVLKFCILEFGKAISGRGKYGSKGGLLYIDEFSKLVIENCIIRHNFSSWNGAGIYIGENSFARIEKNFFSNNYSLNMGGGIASWVNSHPLIKNNIFYKNTAFRIETSGGLITAGGQGSGIATSSPFKKAPKIINNFFSNNKSLTTIWESADIIHVIGNIISNNYGCGIFNGISYSNGIYMNNTVINNFLEGVVVNAPIRPDATLKIVNNVIRNNVYYTGLTVPIGLNTNFDAEPVMIHNNIDGEPWEGAGFGNFNEEPLFVNPTPDYGLDYDGLSADWSLLKESPNINAGIMDTFARFLPQQDLFGNNRIIGATIDIGAVEYDSTTGVENPTSEFLKIYPNPFTGNLWIENKSTEPVLKIRLSDASGKIILDRLLNHSMEMLSLDGLSAGSYFLEVMSDENNKQVYKLLKAD